jgi:CBS domain-containing protein
MATPTALRDADAALQERIVARIMQREVATLRVDDALDLADDVMRLGRIRHLPVLDGMRLVGIVTQRDLLAGSLARAFQVDPRQRRDFLRSVPVREVMAREVVSVGAGATLAQAARLMIERQIGCLPVLDGEGRLAGLVTETDLLRAAYYNEVKEDSVMAEQANGELRERIDKELDELRRVRDELKLRLHLGKADAKASWERLDKRYHELEAHVRRIAQRSETPLHEMADAARKLFDELRAGYRDLRRQL